MHVLRAIAHSLLVPPGCLVVLLTLGLLALRRTPLLGRILCWIGTLSLLLLSLPWAAHALARGTGGYPPFSAAQAQGAQAIVILSSEARSAPEYGGRYTPGDETIQRLRYGSQVARWTGLPILLSGGHTDDASSSLAESMASSLSDDFSLTPRWLETQSRNTRESARYSAAMLTRAAVTTILLVTDDNHMRRSCREFAAAGIRAVPAPMRIPARLTDFSWSDLAPSILAFRDSSMAVYELLGQAEQKLTLPASVGAHCG